MIVAKKSQVTSVITHCIYRRTKGNMVFMSSVS